MAAGPCVIAHTPQDAAEADKPLQIEAVVTGHEYVSAIRLHYRKQGETEYLTVPFERLAVTGDHWAATIPADHITAGVMEYYIATLGAGLPAGAPEVDHFASAQHPHPVAINRDEESRIRLEALALNLGNRSRFQLHSEWIDFGNRTANGQTVSDNFWRAQVDYTYRMFGWVYSIRLGAGVLRGSTFLRDSGQIAQTPDDARCAAGATSFCRVGLTYGFAEVRFRFGSLVRFDLRATLGAGPQNFDGGAGGQLLIGRDPGTHFALGIDGVTSIGARGWARLAWTTVPHVPMSFTIEISDLPNNGDVGGRIYLTLGYRFNRHVALEALGGYAARGWHVGGATVGGSAFFEF